jgi:hypothetical protein
MYTPDYKPDYYTTTEWFDKRAKAALVSNGPSKYASLQVRNQRGPLRRFELIILR